jgi:hypothetical protein
MMSEEKLDSFCPVCRTWDPQQPKDGCTHGFHSKTKACPVCFQKVIHHCYHEDYAPPEVNSVAMTEEVWKEKRLDHLKWEIETAEEQLERDVEEYLRLKYGKAT